MASECGCWPCWYLDYIGADAYNWYNCRPGTSNLWSSMEQLVNPMRLFAQGKTIKGIMIPEWASTEDPAQPRPQGPSGSATPAPCSSSPAGRASRGSCTTPGTNPEHGLAPDPGPWLPSGNQVWGLRMGVLGSRLDRGSDAYRANRAANLELLAELDRLLAQARAGGGQKYVDRHRARGKLLARERVELLLDRDGPFLELSPLAAWGTDFPVGASGVTGVGPVSGVECVVAASDPTVRGGATNPFGLRKTLRAMEIAERNRLPLVQLIESSGADLPTQSQIFIPGGAVR
jgi:hypothetical protein